MEALDDLETYIRTAPILYVGGFPTPGGAHPGKLAILQGGVGVLAKPADANAQAPEMTPREVAAWVVARACGWPDLVSATVLRTDFPGNAGQPVMASCAIVWPDNAPDLNPGFPEDDRWRAAAFDYVVNQTDRGGHNWLAVPKPESGASSLKLIDHGHCFGYPPNAQLNSTFYGEEKGNELPPAIRDALGHLLDDWPGAALQELLQDDVVSNTEERVKDLLERGTL